MRRGLRSILILHALALSPAAFAQDGPRPAIAALPTETVLQTGIASYFAGEMAGRKTANGERCDPATLTAAHRTLPFGTRVRVTDSATGKSVIVRINDRGPFSGKRVIDLSRAAADAIGLTRRGHGEVTLALVEE